MEELHPRCAGIDIGKKYAKVCVRIGPDWSGRAKADRVTEVVTTWGSMTSRILRLREHLVDQQVSCVVMEATGDYWKPYYYLLEDLPRCQVMLVNARHVSLSRAARATSTTRPGWPSWVRTDWSGLRSCRHRLSGSCGI